MWFRSIATRAGIGLLVVAASNVILIRSITDDTSIFICVAYSLAMIGTAMISVAWGEVRGRTIEAEQILPPYDRTYNS